MAFSLSFPEKEVTVYWTVKTARVHCRSPLINPESVVLRVEIFSYPLKTMMSLEYSGVFLFVCLFFTPESLRDLTVHYLVILNLDFFYL